MSERNAITVVVGYPVGLPRAWVSFQDHQYWGADGIKNPEMAHIYYATEFDRPVTVGDLVFLYETDGQAGEDSFGMTGFVVKERGTFYDVDTKDSAFYVTHDWARQSPEGPPPDWRSTFPEKWSCEHLTVSGPMASAPNCSLCNTNTNTNGPA